MLKFWFETRTRMTRITQIFADPRVSVSSVKSVKSVSYRHGFLFTDDESIALNNVIQRIPLAIGRPSFLAI